MAGQSKNQTVGWRFVGIDPGEAHCGWATLGIRYGVYTANTGVLETNAYSIRDLADLLVPYRARVIIEDYQVRPVGHQAFGQAKTARIIGALQYRVESLGAPWTLVPPGDPDKELPSLILGRYLREWSKGWHASKEWQHARAAWRVLARHMLTTEPQLLINIDNPMSRSSLEYNASTGYYLPSGIAAPMATWRAAT